MAPNDAHQLEFIPLQSPLLHWTRTGPAPRQYSTNDSVWCLSLSHERHQKPRKSFASPTLCNAIHHAVRILRPHAKRPGRKGLICQAREGAALKADALPREAFRWLQPQSTTDCMLLREPEPQPLSWATPTFPVHRNPRRKKLLPSF